MTDVKFVEDAPLLGVKRTDAGYLVANVKAARTGVQDYHGFELGHPERERIRVYRPADAVFSKASMATYAGKPLTDDHPSEMVTADNWRSLSVGQIANDDIARDGESVRVPVMLMDAAAIKTVEDGKRQVSAGYTMSLKLLDQPAVTDSGEEYDAIAGDIKINHLALVRAGRAGPEHRIGDAASSTTWGARPITTDGDSQSSFSGDALAPSTAIDRGSNMQTIKKVVDGLTVETTDTGADAIDKLLTERKEARDALTTATTDHAAEVERLKGEHATAIADKDKEIGTKDTEIADLKKQVPDAAALDSLAAARADLISKASALIADAKPDMFAGKSDAEIKRIAVDSVHGADFSKDKPDAWLDGAFDAAKPVEGTGDQVRDSLMGRPATTQANDNGYQARVDRLTNAYKGTTGEAA